MAGFRKATKKAKNLVISFQGASGAGKTFSALNVAKYLCPPGKRIAFIDTENSADLYGDIFDFDVDNDFGPFGKLNYGPLEWMKKLQAAASSKEYGVVVLDSLTHMWKGAGGILAQLDDDAAAYKVKTGRFADTNALWKKFDPMYVKFMNDLRHLPFHVIFCLRAKQKTDRKTNEKGKIEITKLGFEAEFRDGFDYDVDAQFLLDEDHVMVAKKHRLGEFLNGKHFKDPGQNLAEVLSDWLVNGVEETVAVEQPAPVAVAEEPAPQTERAPDTEALIPAAVAVPDAVTATAKEAILAKFALAKTDVELTAIGPDVKKAKANNDITEGEYKEISQAFADRRKALKAAS